MKVSQARALIETFEERSILVVGDVILDRFIWGRVERISPEAPVPVVEIERESRHLGGAANVASNLRVLGARPLLVGVVGEDPAAPELSAELERADIGCEHLIGDSQRRTSTKTRIIAHQQQVCRTDWESRNRLSAASARRLAAACEELLPRVDAIILSDYAKGVLSPKLLSHLIERARRARKFVAVDPKTGEFGSYRGASVVTPNRREAEEAAGRTIEDEESLLKAGRELRAEMNLGHLLMTRGEEGMTLFGEEGEFHIPTVAREVFDVTGAGDTVIATFCLAVASGAPVHQAAVLANHAAGVVVGKLGTAQVTADEVLRSLADQR